jgi:Cft2 family RNA processing exonuclease
MQIKLKFLGDAQNVTGSWHFLYANGIGLLVDCGQEHTSQEHISEIRRVVHSGTSGIED